MKYITIRWAVARLRETFYPPRCILCDCLLDKKDIRRGICASCLGEREQSPGCYVSNCEFLRETVSPFLYRGGVIAMVRRYKFQKATWIATAGGREMARALRERGVDFDAVTYIPLDARRLASRGYDQAELLAAVIARESGKPLLKTLKKIRRIQPQSTRIAAERKANVLGVYQAVKPERYAGKSLLLVDDVVTTGATLSEGARVLRMAGAEEVSGATLASRMVL